MPEIPGTGQADEHVIMKRYLITGFSGFVSFHFLTFLNEEFPESQVLGLDVNPPSFDIEAIKNLNIQFRVIDLLDRENLQKVICDFQPDYVLHLASYSSVAFSWKNPMTSFSNNTNIFLNLLEQIRELGLNCRVLSVGSSEEYGRVDRSQLPLTEGQVLRPISPYAVARVAQEMLSKVYVQGFGMDIVLTRSFNHIGPAQRDIFVISSFARQLVEIKKNKRAAEITTGDLSIVRDFLDVRDVVRAYHLLLVNGKKGELYNICSGNGIALREILDSMMHLLGISVTSRTDSGLIRPDDNPIIVGSNDKLRSATGWAQHFTLDQSLGDILAYWTSII